MATISTLAGTQSGTDCLDSLYNDIVEVNTEVAAFTAGNVAWTYVDKTASYTIIAATDTYGTKVFTNDGATGTITFSLPAGAATMRVNFNVVDAYTLKVSANGTETIRHKSTQTAGGGYLQSATVGDFITLEWNGDEWIVVSIEGHNWTDGTATLNVATATLLGEVELATDAETITGTDSARAVTPANIQAKVASATAKGIVELATDAECVTGTDNERAVTPANIQAKVASATEKGIVELATDAEAITGTDTSRAITAANLDAVLDDRTFNKNAIINGDFNIWQRGTSFAAIVTDTYVADRFRYDKVGAMVHTVSRDTDVPTQVESGHKSNYSLKVDCTTIDAAIAAGDFIATSQMVEGYNFASFVGKTATLSFWVKATKPGIYCVSFRNTPVADRCYVSEYTINVANTWEKKTVTCIFNYTGGTWDYTNGMGIEVTWALASGSDSQGTAGTWNADSDIATSNQVNGVDSTDNNFWLAQVQLELGSVATDFEYRQFGDELAKCHRYTRVQALYIPATTAQSEIINMRDVPTITGGGSGYTSTGTTADTIVHYQTTGAVATLTLAAEL